MTVPAHTIAAHIGVNPMNAAVCAGTAKRDERDQPGITGTGGHLQK